MKHSSLLVATALVSALAAAPVVAQTANSGAGANASSPNATTTSRASSVTSNASGHFLAQADANEWRMTKLKGLNVYNNNNEKLGSIDDLLVDKSGQIKAAVIGVGGFLGIGDHQVAVPFTELQFVYDTNNRGPNTAANTNAAGNQGRNGAGNPSTTNTANTGLGSPAANTANTATSTNTAGVPVAGSVNNAATNARRDNVPDHAVLNATKDQLKSAPGFKWNNNG